MRAFCAAVSAVKGGSGGRLMACSSLGDHGSGFEKYYAASHGKARWRLEEESAHAHGRDFHGAVFVRSGPPWAIAPSSPQWALSMFVPAMTSRCAWRVVSAQCVVLGDLFRRQNSPLSKMGFEVNRSQLALQG